MKDAVLKKTELLAPAGSYESFIAAINAGADAVYMGLKNFNARVMTNNFNTESYVSAIDYAHKRDVKVYLTLNTLLLDSEIKEALESVYTLYCAGLDGVIVQDLGIADLIHKLMPDLSMHASTQMSICNLEQVKVLENMGFERVVLARELAIEEIKDIASNTKMEIEVFVHGALCVSVSGQCLMSAMIGNRSANRGSCAGPCRKKYSLYTTSGKAIEKNKYLLSKKDIFGLDKLQELIDAGVDSLKIEGRNKTPEYVAGVIRSYRQALESGYTKQDEHDVLQLFNRSGKSDGYLKGVRFRNSISELSPKNTGLFLGEVIEVKKQYIKLKLEQDIELHDGIETIGENVSSTIVTCIRNNNFQVYNELIKKGEIAWLGDIHNVKVGDKIYKTSSNSLNMELKNYAKTNMKRLDYDVKVIIKENERITASTLDMEVAIDYVPEISKNSSVDEGRVKEAFSKTEETSIRFNVLCDIQENLFVPTSKLNELRKKLVEKIEGAKIIRRNIENIDQRINEVLQINSKATKKEKKINSLYIYRYNTNIDYITWYKNKYNEELDVMYVTASDFKWFENDVLKYLDRCKVYFAIPNVCLKNTTNYIENNIERLCEKGVYGILIGNIGAMAMCSKLKEKYNIEIVADYSLNVMNKYAAAKLKELGVDRVTPVFENEEINLDSINDVLQVEIVQDMATVMTTRYCVIASFAGRTKEKCGGECRKDNYYLLDELNKRYDIVTDPTDCITRYVRNKKQYTESEQEKFSVRHSIMV